MSNGGRIGCHHDTMACTANLPVVYVNDESQGGHSTPTAILLRAIAAGQFSVFSMREENVYTLNMSGVCLMKIYMTGGTGFVGSNIVKVAVERYDADVFTTVHSWQADGPIPFQYGRVDMGNRQQLLDSVRAFKPDAIIHSAILNDFSQMYQDRRLAWQSYVDSTRYLTEAANEIGAKIILISSDWVFDGTQTNADETTPPNPKNLYGVLKVVGETIVMEAANNGAVARLSGVNGMHWTLPDKPLTQNVGFGNLIPAVVSKLQNSQPFIVWEGEINMYATLSLASESAEMVMRIIQQDKQGIFHCCCGESLTRIKLARAAAEAFDLDAGLIESGQPVWDGMAGVPIPNDTSLSATVTAEQLAYQLPSVRQVLQIYRQQRETRKLA